MTNTMANPTKSILKGALAGFAGGLVGAAAKAYLEGLYAHRLAEPPVPNAHYVDGPIHEIGTALAVTLMPDVAPTLAPWVSLGLAGAAYGAAVEMEPTTSSWQGAAFGLAMGRVGRATSAPDADFTAAGAAAATQARISSRVTHAVFGIVTEIVRRGVRRGLA